MKRGARRSILRLGIEALESRIVLAADGPVINEFLASNSTFPDDEGDSSDFIEIYNPTDTAVDLTGWYLTDDPADLNRWRFPNVSLLPGEYLVVFASGKDRATDPQKLHTNFQLAAEGDYVALVAPNGTDVVSEYGADGTHFLPQQTDISFGVDQGGAIHHLVTTGIDARALVPTGPELGTTWSGGNEPFDDSLWKVGPTGVGYETAPGDYATLIRTNLLERSEQPVFVTGADGTPGGALDLTGTSAHVDTGIKLGAGPKTMVLWAKSPQATDSIWAGNSGQEPGGPAHNQRFYLGAFAQNNALFVGGGAVVTPASGNGAILANTSPHDNQFHQYALVDDGNGTLTVFQDGASLGTLDYGTGSTATQVPPLERDFEIGRAGGSNNVNASAVLDDVALFDRMLSPAEIQTLFAATTVEASGLAPFAYWKFDGTLTDSAGPQHGEFQGASATSLNNTSVYVRIEFDVQNPESLQTLVLDMKYDDGFVAYLNGVEVASAQAPGRNGETGTLAWNSAAPRTHPDSLAVLFESFEISDRIGALQSGTNILAVQGLNANLTSSDMLLLPELTATSAGEAGDEPQFFLTPTPGGPNFDAIAGLSGDVEILQPSGTFVGSLTVELVKPSPTAVIHYATDGSIPNEHSLMYSEPLNLTTTTELAAVAIEPGLHPGPVASATFVALDPSVTDFNSNLPLILLDSVTNISHIDNLSGTVFTGVSSVFIDTDAATGRSSITSDPDHVGRGGLRIRGASARGFAKKSYAFETWDQNNEDVDVSLLGLPAESDWVLHGPYADKSLLRNVLSYKWANDADLYGVRTQLVEAFIGAGRGSVTADDYVGVFVLMEKIKQGPDRVDIAELKPGHNDEPEITGGYIFQRDDGPGFTTARGDQLTYVEPSDDNITAEQTAWIRDYMNQFEAALYGSNFTDPELGYARYIDVDSFINHHILVEMTKENNGYRRSTYYSLDRGGKLSMDIQWDYNFAIGGANYFEAWDPEGWYFEVLQRDRPELPYQHYPRLFQDPEFVQRYWDRWHELRQTVFDTDRLLADIDFYASQVEESQQRNFERWDILDRYVWPNPHWPGEGDQNAPGNSVPVTTFAGEIDWMKSWLPARLEWFDSQAPAPPPQLNQNGGEVGPGFQVSITSPAGIIYYTTDGTDPRLPGGEVSPVAQLAGQIVTETTFVEQGATWQYLDDGSDQAGLGTSDPADATWFASSLFEDDSWKSSPGQFGFGDGDEVTEILFGPNKNNANNDPNDKFTTTYFRNTFQVNDASAIGDLTLRLQRDDGAVVYLNGVEIARSNIPAGPITSSTLAVGEAGSDAAVFSSALARWKLDGNLDDAAGTFDGTLSGGVPVFTTGVDGTAAGALDLTATSNWVDTGLQLGSGPKTLSMWVRSPVEGTNSIWAGNSAVTTQRFYVGVRSGVNQLWIGGGTNVDVFSAPINPHDDTFHHYALVDNGAGTLSLFIDGSATATHALDYGGDSTATQLDFEIGRGGGGAHVLASAIIDDVALFDRVLDAAEIQSIFEKPGTGSEETFLAFPIDPNVLQDGENTIAVEVHLADPSSEDMSFDLELIGDVIDLRPGPVILENTLVIARSFTGETVWSPATSATFVVTSPELRITEINYHPYEPTAEESAVAPGIEADDFEFVEVENVGPSTVNVVGVRFSDGFEFTFPSHELATGQRGVVVRNLAAFQLRYGSGINVLGEFASGRLSDGGERLTLTDAVNRTIIDFEYSDNDPWPQRADGAGGSLELIDPANTPVDPFGKYYRWQGSTSYGGSPGAVGQGPIGVVINEVLAHTDPPVTQTDSIELFNSTDQDIDISGWYLSDSDDDLLKYAIPANTLLGANEYIVFDERHFNPTPLMPDLKDFALSGARGDDVWLVATDSAGRVVSFVDDIHFGASLNGETVGRVPDGSGLLAPLSRNALGCHNGHARVGPLVLSEINFNPGEPSLAALLMDASLVEDDLEFVEIYNPTDQTAILTDWQLRGGIDFDFPAGTTLASGETLIVVSFNPANASNSDRMAAFREHYNIDESVRIAGGWNGQLSDSGEVVRLRRPDEPPAENPLLIPRVTEDAVVYDDLAPWPTDADGQGNSLNRGVPTSFGHSPTSWTAMVPTPGTVDFSASVLGDMTGDGELNADDIDVVVNAVRHGSHVTFYDMNGDLTVDGGDVTHLVESILLTHFGDANLDGTVDAQDFGIWSVHRFQRCSGWATADFNGDGTTDGSDFNLWNQHKFSAAHQHAASMTRHDRVPRAPLHMAAQRISPSVVDTLLRSEASYVFPDHEATAGVLSSALDEKFTGTSRAALDEVLRRRLWKTERNYRFKTAQTATGELPREIDDSPAHLRSSSEP